ncbi:MAG: DNA-3-methyladenine glycosylase 2 family protein [Chitinophagaceae bacterium]|nr:MAG: DNA-3-methyladenine glycosylase 2 family protein [Chitinophagaceae bacterium]
MRLKNLNVPNKLVAATVDGIVGDTTFHLANFRLLCDQLAAKDAQLRGILASHGYPPMWTRSATFATLIHIILEQQVSLASAKAAFLKLKEKLGRITPGRLIMLSDKEMRDCYFSRQKMLYARELAKALLSRQLNLRKLAFMPDEEIRKALTRIKGVGNWTVDVYLMFALQRTDIFPIGDLAMLNAFHDIKSDSRTLSREKILAIAEAWRPYRSIATMLLWHHYIQKKGIRI